MGLIIRSLGFMLLLIMTISSIIALVGAGNTGDTNAKILDYILIRGVEPANGLGSASNTGHYWIEILDENGVPIESYGWFPQDRFLQTNFIPWVDQFVNAVVGVPGELNAQTRTPSEKAGTPTSDPNQGKSADWEYHPVLTNDLTKEEVLGKIRDFANDYKGDWAVWRNCHTFQKELMNDVGLVEPVTSDEQIIVPDLSFGDTNDLGGINFTSIKLNSIAVSTDQEGGVSFDLVLKAQKAEGAGPRIDLINSTLIGLTAFMTGLDVPDNKFWVNLAPWEPDRIIDEQLKQSEVGRIMLEADLQMKRDFSNYGDPCANETGKVLWNLLDKKREALTQQCMDKFPGEIKDINNVWFKPVTRHWIVPDKVYAYTNGTQIYIINASLSVNSEPVANHSSFQVNNQENRTLSKGCLEELNKSAKEYGEYNKELDDRMIQPYIIADVNHGEKYEDLREVYVALALAQWYKSEITSHMDIFRESLGSSNSTGLKTIEPWNSNEVWNKYVYSFENGEYKCWENKTTKMATGNLTKLSYRSAGGVDFGNIRANLVEIDELPPEIQDQVKKAVIDGIINEGKNVFFGSRLHVDLKQGTLVSSSGSKADPNLAMTWYNKGVTLQGQSKLDEAIEAYDEAIRRDPNLAEAWNNKGSTLNNQGKYEEAIKAFDEAIRITTIDNAAKS